MNLDSKDDKMINSPFKLSLSGILDLGLSDHDLIYCTRKASLFKSHKHNEIFVPLVVSTPILSDICLRK